MNWVKWKRKAERSGHIAINTFLRWNMVRVLLKCQLHNRYVFASWSPHTSHINNDICGWGIPAWEFGRSEMLRNERGLRSDGTKVVDKTNMFLPLWPQLHGTIITQYASRSQNTEKKNSIPHRYTNKKSGKMPPLPYSLSLSFWVSRSSTCFKNIFSASTRHCNRRQLSIRYRKTKNRKIINLEVVF